MGQFICYANGKYNIYGTIADGFYYDGGLTLDELRTVAPEQDFEERCERARQKGTSSMIHDSLEEVTDCNRAGENERTLTYEECLERFFTPKKS